MTKLNLCITLSVLLLNLNSRLQGQEIQKIQSKSLAVILEIKGDGHVINKINVLLTKVYEGRAKMFNTKDAVFTDDVLKIKAMDEKGKIIFEGYYDNPLVETKEGFEEGGQTAFNDIIVSKSGSINVRFPLQEYQSRNITLNCFQLLNGQEKLLQIISLNN